jgi:hypothetical protein
MNRLASRMDPSASLPGDNTQQQPQYQPQQYQPQYQPQNNYQNPFGGKGGGYSPQFFDEHDNQPPPASRPQRKDNTPRVTPLPRVVEDSEIKDTGEAVSTMDPGRTATGVGTKAFVPKDATLTDQQVRDAQANQPKPVQIDPATGKPKYQYGTYTAATTEQLSSLSNKENIGAFYTAQANKAKADIAQAKLDLAAAQKSGDIAAMTAAQKAQSDALQRQTSIANDQKQALSQIGKTGYQTTEQIQTAQKAAADKAAADKAAADKAAADKAAAQKAAADKAAADKAAAQKAAADKAAAQKAAAQKTAADKAAAQKAAADKAAADKAAAQKAAAAKTPAPKVAVPAPKPAVKKKAKGGAIIVHKGMTSNLKKQLKNK